ncbi:MAG TPA: bacteriophage holin [bacterium]|nr:bacteriophage holin [bacterium]HQO34507.1 bacteriophage holin [bacterium]HQP97546.1 bacteriophage holin [bacterium]
MDARLKPVALGLAVGILWGLSIFLLTFFIVWHGETMETTAKLGRVYLGYTPSVPGAFIGLAYGFVHGFVSGWLLGAVYNKFAGKA